MTSVTGQWPKRWMGIVRWRVVVAVFQPMGAAVPGAQRGLFQQQERTQHSDTAMPANPVRATRKKPRVGVTQGFLGLKRGA